MIAIVVSRADSASVHVGERLLEVGDWTSREDGSRPDAAGGGTYYRTEGFELREFADLHIELSNPAAAFGRGDGGGDGRAEVDREDGIDENDREDGSDEPRGGDPDLLVFVSRHSGNTGPLLTAHVTGNFGPAEYGGEPRTLARAAPGAVDRVVDAMATHAPEGYDVGIECTHHGPTDTAVPSLFAELGSDESEWSDPDGARAVARAVLALRGTGPNRTGPDGRNRHVVGFGGGHYAPRFTRIVRETEWAVGHVGADWALGEMGAPDANRDVIEAAFERSRADHAVIEGDRPTLADAIRGLGHRVVSETWVREVGDRPLDLVDHLEAAIESVDEGLRFGSVVPEDDAIDRDDEDIPADPADTVVVRELPADLLARAQGVDAAAARAAVEVNAVAFGTEQAGTRAAGKAAFAADGASPGHADLVADLAAVLEAGYEEVVVEGDAVVARETAFDPALAADLGVPEGPAFGRLASGEPVEVDGETIDPEAVSTRSEERFPIE
ncbi:D-aminoacyl-tRNA deacylase [Halorubrum aethiopicum]|uniref:D-aminoacyl-tRNA deacylase n=1 Tax=Halorubrum aethiopicum TaxID=1758255 RepID=UPI00082F230A|nr:D-aminoacyl-tRNA deacylase [Halorubrum aethiopicum]